jgi:hypothetical protein
MGIRARFGSGRGLARDLYLSRRGRSRSGDRSLDTAVQCRAASSAAERFRREVGKPVSGIFRF